MSELAKKNLINAILAIDKIVDPGRLVSDAELREKLMQLEYEEIEARHQHAVEQRARFDRSNERRTLMRRQFKNEAKKWYDVNVKGTPYELLFENALIVYSGEQIQKIMESTQLLSAFEKAKDATFSNELRMYKRCNPKNKM